MKQEDKDLLLQDLCGRLPYGLKGILCEDGVWTLDKIWTKKGYESVVFAGDYYDVGCFKPYLFPLSSMTEEQREEWKSLMIKDPFGILYYTVESYDYLYKNHIDIRGLIPMGLAIDCTNLNIY